MNKLVDNPLVKNEMLIEPGSVKEGLIARATSQAATQGDVSNFQRLLNPNPVNDALLVERNRASNNDPANKLNASTSYGDSQLVALNRASEKNLQKEEGHHYSAQGSVLTEKPDADVQVTKAFSQPSILQSNQSTQTQTVHEGKLKTDSKTGLATDLKDASAFSESQLAGLDDTSAQGVQKKEVNRPSAGCSALATNQMAESLPIQTHDQLPILPDKRRVQSSDQTPPQLKASPTVKVSVSAADVHLAVSADSSAEHYQVLGEGSVNPQTDVGLTTQAIPMAANFAPEGAEVIQRVNAYTSVGLTQAMPMGPTSAPEGTAVKPSLTKDAGHQLTPASQVSEILVSSLGAGLATVAAESKRFMTKLGDAATFGKQLLPVGQAKEKVLSGEVTSKALNKPSNWDVADKLNAKLQADQQDLALSHTKGGMSILQQDINQMTSVDKLSTSINELDALVKKITQQVIVSDAQSAKSAVQFTVQDGLLANSEIRIQRHLGEINIVFRIPEGVNPSMMESLHGQLSRHLSEQLTHEIVSVEFEASAEDDHSPDDSNAHQDQQQSSDDPFTWVEEEEDNS